ncbi:MAG: ribonuclease T2 family protein [Paracoccaceae bacterium]
MRKRLALLAAMMIGAGPVLGDGEPAGAFDYYVLALSWSPSWCALEGDQRGSPQCERPLGWVLHGLWPQNERGWPSYCRTGARDPARSQTAAMSDIMGTPGAAWYQWKKHGRCAGLSAQDYFEAARSAYDAIAKPPVFDKLDRPVTLPASLIEEAFLQANPTLEADMITITCKDRRIQEARICLTRDFEPRNCSAQTRRDCTMQDALLDPIEE